MGETPREEFLSVFVEEAPLATQKAFLKDLSLRIVDKFILHEDKVNAKSTSQNLRCHNYT